MVRDNIKGDRCVLCGEGATVRVRGTSFCASCGLEQHPAKPPDVVSEQRSQGFAAHRAFSSGFLAKMLLGAIVVAAVGGVVASTIRTEVGEAGDLPGAASLVTTPASSPPEPVASPVAGTAVSATTTALPPGPAASGSDVLAARQYAAAVQAWADCVLRAAVAHPGGPFEPGAACPDKPDPGDFELGGEGYTTPSGHHADSPGSSDDPAD